MDIKENLLLLENGKEEAKKLAGSDSETQAILISILIQKLELIDTLIVSECPDPFIDQYKPIQESIGKDLTDLIKLV